MLLIVEPDLHAQYGVIVPRSLLRIRRSARAFARAPGLSFGLLFAIALGVGSNAAVYGFLQGLINPATPFRGSGRIVSIFRQDRFRDAESLSPNEYQLLENSDRVFEWIGAARIKLTDAMIGGRSEIATVAAITDKLAGAVAIPLDNGVVISHRIWESEFGSRENAVGSDIRIDNVDFRISGVAPKHFDGLYSDQSVDLWIQTKRTNLQDARDGRNLFVIACLRSGVSLSQAQTTLRSGSAGLSEVSLTPFTGIAPNITRGLTRIGLFLNFSAAAVFFIACINVASFLLGRALKRSHDTSLRTALGATRAELLRDLFADSIVISIAGGVMGLLLGILTARTLPVLLFQDDAERLSFAPRLIPILTASMVCIVITVVCGMTPVLGTMTDRPWIVLKRESGSPSKAIQRLRSALVVGQITVCCILVICTALLLNGLHSALVTSAGHRLGDPVLLTVQARTLPEVDFNYFSEVEQRAKSVAGLSPLAWTAELPGNQPTWRAFRIQQPSPQYGDVAMDIAWLTPDSLQLLESPPIAGRMFGFKDPGHRVAVVDEEAAAQLFGRQTVGMVILDSTDLPIEIIGVVRRKGNGARQQRRPTIYYGFVDQSAAPRPIRDAPFRVPLVPPIASIELNANVVSANYFAVLDMPLMAGKTFSEGLIPGQKRVGVINQEAADFYFDGKPIGAGVIDDRGVRTEIIGVVRSQVLGTFEQLAKPTIYFPMWQDCPPRMTLILKNSTRNSSIAAGLRRKIENVPGQGSAPIAIKTLYTQLAQSGLAGLRIATLIGGTSAATALILSILGLISVQGDAEHHRQREQALRIALGAPRWRIVFVIVTNAARLAFVGTVIGASLSLALVRLLAADMTGFTSPPFQVWLIAPLLASAAVMIASVVPARRASGISPSAILHDS